MTKDLPSFNKGPLNPLKKIYVFSNRHTHIQTVCLYLRSMRKQVMTNEPALAEPIRAKGLMRGNSSLLIPGRIEHTLKTKQHECHFHYILRIFNTLIQPFCACGTIISGDSFVQLYSFLQSNYFSLRFNCRMSSSTKSLKRDPVWSYQRITKSMHNSQIYLTTRLFLRQFVYFIPRRPVQPLQRFQ